MIIINDNYVKIRQATTQGWIALPLVNGGAIADLSFPTSKLRRGRVQENGQICPALTCGGISGLYIFEERKNK